MSKKTIIFGILLILWMGLIFFMSSSSGEESGGMSQDIIMFIVNKYDKITNASQETIEYHKSEDFINSANLVFRKICHFSEYMILGILALNFIYSFNKFSLMLCSVYSLIFSIVYASLDEYHQTFVDGRAGAVTDVLIDSFGAIIGIVVIYIIFHKKICKKLEKE